MRTAKRSGASSKASENKTSKSKPGITTVVNPVVPDELAGLIEEGATGETIADTYSKFLFETPGDRITGYFIGIKKIERDDDEPFEVARFVLVPSGLKIQTALNFQLRQALEKETELGNYIYVITLKGFTKTAQASPMKDFQIDRFPAKVKLNAGVLQIPSTK